MITANIAPITELQQATVLLVEDDLAILDGVADLLEFSADKYEIEILKAENGVKALALFEQHTPDLVISDIAMPLMDGYAFLAAVRANPNWAHIPFILLTAQTSNRQISNGLSQGVELYLTKPFNSFELVDLVETQLGKSLQQRVVRKSRESQMRRDLSRTMQHELRTPLGLVTAYLEILDMSVDTEFSNAPLNLEELQEYLRGIDVGIKRLTRLVNDIVAALDLRAGHTLTHIRTESIFFSEIEPLLHAALAEAQAANNHSHATVHFDLPTELGFIYGQKTCLQNAFARLIDNAFKFTKFKGVGEITIRATILDRTSAEHSYGYLQPGADGALQIEIIDDGIGFPHHIRWQLPELFYQHNREEWEQQGSGIGLTLVKGIIEAHNGQIKLRAIPDKGATITVSLPLYKAPTNTPEIGSIPEVKRSATVLLIDDNPMVREVFVELVELMETHFHFNILLAEDGKQGLAALEKVIPDLIVSDIRMPNMTGLEMLAILRQNPAFAEIPVILLTANHKPKQIHNGRMMGADEYIAKPYKPQYLIDRMETLIRRNFEKQAAEAGNFDTLKERILTSVELGIVNTLNSLAQQSKTMHRLVTGQTSVAASTDVTMLRQSLVGLQQNSSQISSMVRNATVLVEIRTGAAEASFKSRAGMIENLADLVGAAVRDFKAIHAASSKQLDGNCHIEIEHGQLPLPIYGNAKMLSAAFSHLLTLLATQHADAGHLKICVFSVDGAPVVSAECNSLMLCDQQIDTIRSIHNGEQQLDTSVANASIFYEYMQLHSAEIDTEKSEDTFSLSIRFKPFSLAS